MSGLWSLVLLCKLLSLAIGQSVNESRCTYTFTVPLEYFESQCMTHELRSNLEEIRRENKQITSENAKLKEKIENLSKEYGDMVETVKKLERETSNWRQIVEWPSYDTPFAPQNIKDVIEDQTIYEDCYKAIRKGSGKEGVYLMQPRDAPQSFVAYCDAEGWTVIERRLDGNISFYRDWSAFSGGFGDVGAEYWIGLEKMHMFTNAKKYQLRIEALGWNDKLYTAEHDHFYVGEEKTRYQLSIGNMTAGNSEDVMTTLNGLPFTTKLRDYDQWSGGNCAEHYKGGWWLNSCGFDPNREFCDFEGCMSWGDTKIKKIQLKIRPMAAKDVQVKKSKPARVTKPRAKVGKPTKKVKKPKKTKKTQNQPSFF